MPIFPCMASLKVQFLKQSDGRFGVLHDDKQMKACDLQNVLVLSVLIFPDPVFRHRVHEVDRQGISSKIEPRPAAEETVARTDVSITGEGYASGKDSLFRIETAAESDLSPHGARR